MIRFPALLAALSFITPLWAGDSLTPRATLAIPKVKEPPSIEERLNGPAPGTGRSIETETELELNDFRQYEPGDGTKVSLPTRAHLSHDSRALFITFICKDDPHAVRARMAKREDIGSDDRVVVYLDTFRDGQRAYIFAANPLGIQKDGVLTEGQDDDYSFDTLWHAEGKLTEDGFVVRMTIPFKSLRFPRAPEQSWGIALGRIIPRNSEESYWPYITKRVKGFVPQLAAVGGLRDISPGRNIQLIPHATAARARFLVEDDAAYSTETDRNIGLDAKAVFKDAFTLDATVNPDFSQVESDEPQVTINQRFEVSFPEKRPFFIENAGFFQTPIRLFFSRRIIDPRYGGRLTGKAGPWAIGTLVMDDRALGAFDDDFDRSLDSRAGLGVLRMQREFGGQSNLGFLATSRDLGPTHNRVLGVDTRIKFSDTWVLSGQAGLSQTKDALGRNLDGRAYFAKLQREGRHFQYDGRYLDLSPEFQAHLGFVRRVDMRQTEHEAKYRWRRDDGFILKFGPTVGGLFNWDHSGRLQDWRAEGSFDIDLSGNTAIELEHREAYEFFEGQGFRKRSTGGSLSTEWLKWLSIGAEYHFGTEVNFDPAPGLPPFRGGWMEGELQLTLRPTPRFRLDQLFIFSHLKTEQPFPHLNTPAGATVYDNPILRSNLTYQFTRALSLRAILDYESILPNQVLVDLEKEKRFAADILLTYLVNPWTAIYLGYTDNYENLLLEGEPPTVRRGPRNLQSVGRQVFFKVSYLARF
jgi:hypothetical protein